MPAAHNASGQWNNRQKLCNSRLQKFQRHVKGTLSSIEGTLIGWDETLDDLTS